jgi:hypothetical protein
MKTNFWVLFGSIWLVVGVSFLAVGIPVSIGTMPAPAGDSAAQPWIFVGLGLALTMAGGAIAGTAIRRERLRRWLLKAGVRAEAAVVDVGPSNLTINGRRQWRLHYSYRDYRNQAHDGRIYLDAVEAHRWQPGHRGAVMFDPDRPQRAVWVGAYESSEQPAVSTGDIP